MKFTLSWLKDHLETASSLDDILYALTDLGLEVDNPLASLRLYVAAIHAEKIGRKLRVCRVMTDEGKADCLWCAHP